MLKTHPWPGGSQPTRQLSSVARRWKVCDHLPLSEFRCERARVEPVMKAQLIQYARPGWNENTQLERSERSHSLTSADGRVVTWATRRRKKLVQGKNVGTLLTPTGLLMEGHYTQNPRHRRR